MYGVRVHVRVRSVRVRVRVSVRVCVRVRVRLRVRVRVRLRVRVLQYENYIHVSGRILSLLEISLCTRDAAMASKSNAENEQTTVIHFCLLFFKGLVAFCHSIAFIFFHTRGTFIYSNIHS